MEIVFRNRIEDFQAFYDYAVTQTEEGRRVSSCALRYKQEAAVAGSVIFGLWVWAIMSAFVSGLVAGVAMLVLLVSLTLVISRFKPRYWAGMQAYKAAEKNLNPKDLQVFVLPKSLTTSDSWLQIQNSEVAHRWHWRRVDHIGITPDFVFVHVGNCPVVYVPRRDFSTEQDFVEFGKVLSGLRDKHADQPIAAHNLAQAPSTKTP